jgi:CubicO group peptidase (beta-lactamase class C family)
VPRFVCGAVDRRQFLAVTAAGLGRVVAPAAAEDRPTFPGRDWAAGEPPAAERADALRALLRAGDSTGLLAVRRGRAIFEYGDVRATSYLASARKSLVSMLYGRYVADGTVRLGTTLRELAFDDVGGLLPSEREATVGDLLAARSGVYHRAANLGDASDRAPARGSVRHGRYFLYNNWDFNALGAILEQVTGRSLYDVFTTDIAAPIGLQDWNPAPGAYRDAIRNDTGLSRHPAHHFVLSTRDMARVGYLMLRNGRWGDRQVLPAAWVRRSSRTVTPAAEVARTSPFIDGLGYGLLWWTFDGDAFRRTPLRGGYTASGAFGQFITVVPRLDLVVAHKTAVPPPRNVGADVYVGRILPAILALVR